MDNAFDIKMTVKSGTIEIVSNSRVPFRIYQLANQQSQSVTWGINLYLENIQVRIQVRIKPDIFLRFSNLNIFPGSNLKISY